MIKYSTLENVSNEVLFDTNWKTMSERLKKEVNLERFCEMLREQDYDPTISVGAFDTETKRDNLIAQSMYRSLGFEIKDEVVTTLKTLNGSRQVEQVEVVMKL